MHKNTDRVPRISMLSVAAVAIVALAACNACSSSTPTASPGPTSVLTTPSSPSPAATTITPPLSAAGRLMGLRDSSKVAYQQQVNGVVTGRPPGTQAWIVVYPVLAPGYWPQPGPLQLDPHGGFQTSVYFGGPQNIGEDFIIRLVVASPAASARFQAFLAQTPSQGMPRLPPSVLTLTQVTVTRR